MAKAEITICDDEDCDQQADVTYRIEQEGGDTFVVDFCHTHARKLSALAALGRPGAGRFSLQTQLDTMWVDDDNWTRRQPPEGA